MKKNRIYMLCIVLFVVAIAGIIWKYQNKKKEDETIIYPILERKGPSDTTAEFRLVKTKAAEYMAAIKENPTDVKSLLKLTSLYIQEARETGNFAYYDKAGMKCANTVLTYQPQNFGALVFKSLIYMSQHHFADGLQVAQQAQQVNPNNAYVYGLLVDGEVEMGKYDSAITNADKMISIRPDLTSYSRASYLREIFGNYKSAIEAMKMAVEAGGQGDEHTEWTRTQLGNLYEKIGDYKSADTLYNTSLAMRPNYPYALAGLGRNALANGDYPTAIKYFETADSTINDFSIEEDLSDAYRLSGNTDKADKLMKKVIEDLTANSQSSSDDGTVGHYSDRELAYAYLKVKDNDKALDHAMLEYNRRPDNIDVNETVAWVLYNRGEFAKAVPYIKTALKTNSKNPTLLARAGLIYAKAGDKATAKNLLQQVAANPSYIGYDLRNESKLNMQFL